MPPENRDRNSAAHKKGDAIKTRSEPQDLERKLREGERAANIENPPEDAARGKATSEKSHGDRHRS